MLIKTPPSKSQTHRALFLASLAKGVSTIQNPLICEDTCATISCLEQFGVKIEQKENECIVHGGAWKAPNRPLNCVESGTTWRFLTALTKILNIPVTLEGKPSLLSRPILPLHKTLEEIQNSVQDKQNISCTLESHMTSQFLSALLIGAPLLLQPILIRLKTPLVSKPYVSLTLEMQKKFGVFVEEEDSFAQFSVKPQEYKPTDVVIEGDWSSAAFFIAAHLLSHEGTVAGLNAHSLQGDRTILTVVKEMGGSLEWNKDKLLVQRSHLHAIEWDLKETPDLFPAVAILCACAKGKSLLFGVKRLTQKESNRPKEMQKLLKEAKIACGFENDLFWIKGGSPKPCTSTSKDHRIIMAASLLDLMAEGKMEIQNRECVTKSFPNFWENFERLKYGK